MVGVIDQKLILEAEMGRAFVELEKAKALQVQLTQQINSVIQELEKLKEHQNEPQSN